MKCPAKTILIRSTAKQVATKLSRLATLIKDSEEGKKIKPLDYPKKK